MRKLQKKKKNLEQNLFKILWINRHIRVFQGKLWLIVNKINKVLMKPPCLNFYYTVPTPFISILKRENIMT